MTDPAGDFAAAVPVTAALLEGIRMQVPDCVFLLFSSAAVYGNPATLPVYENALIAPLSPYGFHKRQCELLCAEYSTVFGVRTACLRIFSAYGKGLKRQVLWDICQKAISGRHVKLQGTGEESRDFVHGRDVAEAVWCVLHHGRLMGESYNVATATETTIASAANHILRSLELEDRALVFQGTLPPGTPRRWRADLRAIRALGFVPTVDFDAGVAELAHWAKQWKMP